MSVRDDLVTFVQASMQPAWAAERMILLCQSGSQAYGTAHATSDYDIRGVTIPPRPYFTGFLHRFEQAQAKGVFRKLDQERDVDAVLYDLRKFCQLAADCNPNVIELLFVDEADVLFASEAGRALREQRHLFLSTKAQHTFSGYAMAQLKRIKTHRKWLLSPPTGQPSRAAYGLPEETILSADILGAIDALQTAAARAEEVGEVAKVSMPAHVMEIYRQERSYQNALREWQQYQGWKRDRNAARAETEAAFGYDCYLDDGTEFLTEHGWKRYDDVRDGELLASINPLSGRLTFEPFSERVAKPYTGPLFFIETRTTACAVTPNHRMWLSPARRSRASGFSAAYDPRRADWRFGSMQSISEGRRSWHHARVTCSPFDAEATGRSDDLLILVGAYVSEGCVGKRLTSGAPSVLRISQRSGGRLEPFMESLRVRFPEKVRRFVSERREPHRREPCTEIVWTVADRGWAQDIVAACGEGSASKRLPRWSCYLSRRQQNLLLDVLIAGDGTERDHSRIYYTSSRQLADDVQVLCLSSGRVSQVWGPYGYDDGRVPMFHVYVGPEAEATAVCTRPGDRHVTVRHVVNERIVCFTVPSEILITRRNGKVAIQGNTKHAMHLVRLMRMGCELLRDGVLHVRRPDAAELLRIRNGDWSYDRLIGWAEEMDAGMKQYATTSTLPKKPNRKAIDRLCRDLVARYVMTEPESDVDDPGAA